MKKWSGKNVPAIFLSVSFLTLAVACKSGKEITEKELTEHIRYLASPELSGRLTGAEGDSLAALYIKTQLESFGLRPITGDGFQRYKVTSKLVAGTGNKLTIDNKSFISGTDFTPFAFSSSSSLNAGVVFAGYGFNIETDSLRWNDYENIDI